MLGERHDQLDHANRVVEYLFSLGSPNFVFVTVNRSGKNFFSSESSAPFKTFIIFYRKIIVFNAIYPPEPPLKISIYSDVFQENISVQVL